MLKIGLLGAGRIGNVHAKAITSHADSKLVAVSDVNQDAAGKLAAQYGAEARTSEAIIADCQIEAVLIRAMTNCSRGVMSALGSERMMAACANSRHQPESINPDHRYIGPKLSVPDEPTTWRYFRMRGSILTSFILNDPQALICSFKSTARPRYFHAMGEANGCL